MNLKLWLGRGGKHPLRPKDDGMGLMASALKCREFGFWYKLTAEQLKTINEFRKMQRPTYIDGAAAIKIRGTDKKGDLESSPFLTLFDYGKNAEGYWTYDRMIGQMEDCIDVLDALHSERVTGTDQKHMTPVPYAKDTLLRRRFDYLFLFDHSCGHDRKRPDGLDVNQLRKGPSASARLMRQTIIEKAHGYLGTYNHSKKLKVGMWQKTVFEETDNFGNEETGPVLKDSQCKVKYDVIDGYEDVDKICDDLRADLEAATPPINSQGTKAMLIQKCINARIPIKKRVPNVVEHGYIGNAKGAYQILWERGLVKPDVKDQDEYTMKGKTDELGNVQKETSINHLVRQLEDFVHEKTLLQYNGEKLGCIIDRSPKCTPEIAGDGIEYDWAMAKIWYRKQPWEDKKKKEKFRLLVEEALSDTVLSLERTRHFSRRARDYMISYYKLQKDEKATTPSDVKKFKTKRKSHTCVLDELHGLFSSMVRDLIVRNKN